MCQVGAGCAQKEEILFLLEGHVVVRSQMNVANRQDLEIIRALRCSNSGRRKTKELVLRVIVSYNIVFAEELGNVEGSCD